MYVYLQERLTIILNTYQNRNATDVKRKIGRVEHEHTQLKASKTSISRGSGTKSDARSAPKPILDSDLMKIIESWVELPEHIKAAIKALVQTHKGENE